MTFDDTQCTLGEGPLWHPERAELLWFDILGKRLLSKTKTWDFDEYVSAAGWIDRDRILMATQTRLQVFDLASGTTDHVVDLEADNPITRSNDGRADPQGGFWIGTMGIDAEPGAGAIYRYYRGELRKTIPDIQISNAICFAPDGNTAFYTDTNTQQIMATALDADGWPKGTPYVHINLTGTPFRPDGAIVDSDGNLFSAQWGVGRVAVYNPKGAFVEAFDMPAIQSSCPALGGPDLSTLFCTSAAVGRDGADDGKTFAIQTTYTGQTEHRVIL